MKQQEKIEAVLPEVKLEVERFLRKLKEAELRFEKEKTEKWQKASHKESAALRRAALDLKNELTLITQSTAY